MKDYRTTAEVETSRCMRPRQAWKPCACGKKAGKECSREVNLRVPRIVKAISRGLHPDAVAGRLAHTFDDGL